MQKDERVKGLKRDMLVKEQEEEVEERRGIESMGMWVRHDQRKRNFGKEAKRVEKRTKSMKGGGTSEDEK